MCQGFSKGSHDVGVHERETCLQNAEVGGISVGLFKRPRRADDPSVGIHRALSLAISYLTF